MSELSQRIGIGETNLTAVRNGQTATSRTILQVASALECEPEAFIADGDLHQWRADHSSLPPNWDRRLTVQDLLSQTRVGFCPRIQLRNAVLKFFEERDRGLIILEGYPGTGKSTFLAALVDEFQWVGHFFRRTLGQTSLDQCAATLLAEALALQPDLGSLTHLSKLNPEQKTSFLFGADSTDRMVYAIDALDESDQKAQSTLIPAQMGNGTFLTVATRPGVCDTPVGVPCTRLSLEEFADDTRNAAENWLDRWWTLDQMQERVATKARPAFTEDVLRITACNFMYLFYVMDSVSCGALDPQDLDKLPVGLQAYYEQHWRSMMPIQDSTALAVIYALSEAESPLSIRQLAAITKNNAVRVEEVLASCSQFVMKKRIQNSWLYSFYHESFRDFLRSKPAVEAAGIDLEQVQEDIVSAFWDKLKDLK